MGSMAALQAILTSLKAKRHIRSMPLEYCHPIRKPNP